MDPGTRSLLSEGMGPAVSRAAAIERSRRGALEGRAAGGRLRARALHLHQHGLVSRVARRCARRLSHAGEYDQLWTNRRAKVKRECWKSFLGHDLNPGV